jgi:hypothetical protein
MATYLVNAPAALDFSIVAVDSDSANQTLVLTNLAGGSGDIHISATTMSGDFSIVSGGGAATIAVGATHNIVLKFHPTTKGVLPGILTITSDATVNPVYIYMVGIGGGREVQYALPTIYNLPVGTVKAYLYLDYRYPAITVPAGVSFLDVGDLKESVDAQAGTTEIDNMKIKIAEDYTTYPEGFWYKLLYGYPVDYTVDIMFATVNGANEEFYFRGSVFRKNTYATEEYLNVLSATPTDWVRGIELELMSALTTSKNISMGDLCTIIRAHFTQFIPLDYGATTTRNYATFKSVVAAIIELTYGVAYDESLVINNADDFQLKSTAFGADWISWIDALIPYTFFYTYNQAPPPLVQSSGTYYDSYSNAWEMLAHICQSWGAVPKYSFGNTSGLIDATPANNKHRISFNSRGLSGNLITMDGGITESKICAETSRKAKRLLVNGIFQTATNIFFWDGLLYTQAVVDPWRQFEKTIQTDFLSGGATEYTQLFQDNGSGNCTHCAYVRYWNYYTGAYVEPNDYPTALCHYMFYRFSYSRIEYKRTYDSIKATKSGNSSQMWLQNLMQHTINDGVTERYFYSTEYSKSLKSNKADVVWIEAGDTTLP